MASTALTVIKDLPRRITAFARKTLTILSDRTGFIPISAVHASVTRIDTNRGLHANVVMAPVMWMQRTFTEAEMVVQRRKQDGIWERVLDHPLEELICEPNEAYDGDALWKATVLSYAMDGNAFWWKVRNAYGEVIELWYIPHWMIRPIWPLENSEFIPAYQVTMGLQMPFTLLPRDVVHFRFGIDPEYPRLGLSPLKSVMREVETDMQAAEFSETVLDNMGVPSLIVSPKDNSQPITPEQLTELRNYLMTAASGRNRGNGIVLGKASDITQLGFDPNKIMLPNLRDISEERVCAILGIPAAVVGFGAGLQTTKVGATMREVVKLAWIQCLIPMQKTMARQVTIQLLPDFVSQTRRFRARFDMTEASSFQEEFDLRVSSVSRLVEKGILRVDRAQQMLGLEVDDTREVYLVPTATPEVDPAADPAVTTAPTDPTQLLPADSPLPADTLSPDVVKMLRGIRSRLPSRLLNGNH
jgi:HK97 family phage portal protein